MIHVFLFDQSAVLQNLQALKVFLISPSCRVEAPLAAGSFLTPESTSCSSGLPAHAPKMHGSRDLAEGSLLSYYWGYFSSWLLHIVVLQ